MQKEVDRLERLIDQLTQAVNEHADQQLYNAKELENLK